MNYQDYPNYTKTFIVMRCSGFGVMEAPYQDEEVVFETDNEDEAYAESNRLRETNNTPEQIKSSWIPNTYWVHVNTSTEAGKKLLAEFQREANERLENLKQQPNYKMVTIGRVTVHTTTDDSFFDSSPKITGSAMEDVVWDGNSWVPANKPLISSSHTFLNFKNDDNKAKD